MRITALVIFILCLNLSSSILASIGLFSTIPTNANEQGLIGSIDDTVANHSYLAANVQSQSVIQQVGDFVTGLFTFIGIFFKSIFLPQTMLENFGIPHDLARWFTYPIYLIYVIAIIQMISGRYIE
jgi:hypothetical protein